MMKALITCLCLAPLSLASFVGPAFSGRGASFIRIRTQIFSKEAADHLKELDGKWDDLKGKVKSGENVDLKVTEEILETALDFVQTKEQAEGERIDQAHALLESALRQEGILEDAVDEAHNDALDAHEEMLKRVSSEDKEMRREMAVIDISHGVEDYATERLHEAQDMEAKAKEEEQEAMKNLAELQRKQDELKTALESTKMMEWDEKLQNM